MDHSPAEVEEIVTAVGLDLIQLHGNEEIERLRSQPCPHVTGTVTKHCTLTPFTLTDAEREAINVAQNLMAGTAYAKAFGSLLERTGGGE